jgi:putative endonuclease
LGEGAHPESVCIGNFWIMKIFHTYILKSLKDGRYYYGSCEELEKRLCEHNAGKVAATKYRRPFVVHYVEVFTTRSEAYKREKFFKSIEGYKWLKEQKIT